MTQLIAITTTSDDREELDRIAQRLIQQKYAACCQVGGPITSIYQWDGKTESSQEWTCTIKTTEHRFSDVEQEINNLHHYDTPQIVAVKITAVSESYRQWVVDCVSVPS